MKIKKQTGIIIVLLIVLLITLPEFILSRYTDFISGSIEKNITVVRSFYDANGRLPTNLDEMSEYADGNHLKFDTKKYTQMSCSLSNETVIVKFKEQGGKHGTLSFPLSKN